ncbi:hypothetical protein D3C71_690970 [compost metagenome]
MRARQEQEIVALGRRVRLCCRLRITDHNVRIGAAETEGIDPHEPRFLCRKQFDGGCIDPYVECIEIDVLIRRFNMQRGRKIVVLQSQHGLEQTKQTGNRLSVTDIRLDRADRKRSAAFLTDDITDCPDLGGIADPRAGSVTFDEGHAVHVNAVALVDGIEQVGLCLTRRKTDAVGAAGRIDAGRVDSGITAIMLLTRDIAAAKNDGSAAFGTYITLTVGVVSTAEAFRRQHACLSEADEGKRMDEKVNAANNCRVDIATFQRTCRLVQRDQRGGTGRIDRHARAVQAKNVRDAVGNNRKRIARHEIRAAGSGIFRRKVTTVEA